MIEHLTGFPDNVVAFECKGHVTKHDYETVLEPAVAKALKDHKKIRLYYQVGEAFEEIDPSAVWEDIKVGIEHLTKWERLAVVTDVAWIKRTMTMFGFLIPCEIKAFPMSEMKQARDWIVSA